MPYEGTSPIGYYFRVAESADASVKVFEFEASAFEIAIYSISQSDCQFILSSYLLSRQSARKSSSVGHDG